MHQCTQCQSMTSFSRHLKLTYPRGQQLRGSSPDSSHLKPKANVGSPESPSMKERMIKHVPGVQQFIGADANFDFQHSQLGQAWRGEVPGSI